MPRAFLIKKKKCYADVHGHDGHHHVVNSVTHQDDEGLFPKTKKRKSYEAMSTRLKNEVQTWSNDKQVSYDSGSESGCYSTSSRSPSPNMTTTKSATVQTSNYGHHHHHHQLSSHHQLFHVPHVGDTASATPTSPSTASAILDPLKLSPVQWMRPFLAPYLPINFPYPYHHPHQLSAEAPYQQFGGSRASPLYQSRVEPPSPSYPCPLSPYTPPARDANHKNVEKKRVKQLSSPSPSSSSWSDVERCCSNESSDLGEDVKPKTTDVSGAKVVTKRRTSDTIGGSARYQCPDCHKSYSTYSGLSKHQQFHCTTTNKRSFSCKFCEKVYLSLGALKMHIRTHTLPCKCNLCGKAFSRPWLLQGHIRTHTGEKPFSCSHCNRAFADRSNLRAHLQTHSDIKKYSCKMCSKTFSRMSLLLKHEDSNCCTANSNVIVNVNNNQ